MSIEYIIGDITKETTGLIVHQVNCQRVMGSGVALAIKNKWPIVYAKYLQSKQRLGDVQFVEVGYDLYVCNLFGQRYFGNDGKKYTNLHAIARGLYECFEYCDDEGLELKMPKIGCLRGGADWETEILPIIETWMEEFPNVVVKVIDLV